MQLDEQLNQLKIGFNNKAIDYLVDKRLKTSNYRGQHLVQHYRYNFDFIYNLLTILDKYAPQKQLLAIRTKDLKDQPEDLPEWKEYSKMCNEIKKTLKKGTQDSIRKILFVDINRLGFINRYDKKKELIPPYSKKEIKYVSINDLGLDLLKCKNILQKGFFIGKYVNQLLNNCIDNLLYVLRNGINHIDIYEYMFFMTAIDFESDFMLTKNEAIEYIKEYKNLSKAQKIAFTDKLSEIMVPKKGDKKGSNRKDFHNWKNETQSLFNNFLKDVVYFNLEGTEKPKIKLSKKGGLFSDNDNKLDRSIYARQKYMKEHRVTQKDGFELHHIIPLAFSTNLMHFKMLDSWENLIYIDAYSHRQIKQHIILKEGNSYDLKLVDYSKKEIYLKDKENTLYGYDKKQTMLDYNEELRKI